MQKRATVPESEVHIFGEIKYKCESGGEYTSVGRKMNDGE